MTDTDDGPSIVLICFLVGLLIPLSCLICCTVAIRQSEARYRRFNDDEWHIDDGGGALPSIATPLRGCNAVGCGCGPSCAASVLLFLVDRLAVRPALRSSLEQMKHAERSGRVDPILCSNEARQNMVKRIDEFYNDICSSQTLSLTSKVLNYAGAAKCLSNHRALLEKGMSPEVAAERVVQPVFIVSLPRTGTTILHRTMSLDRDRWRSFDLCDMVCPLSPSAPVARNDLEGRKKLAERAAREFGAVDSLFPGWLDCMETMHGFRFDEADEDLGWYDTGLGHMYMDVLILMYPEQRAKPGGISHLESTECARYRYAWLDMIMRIYQHADNVRSTLECAQATTTSYGSITPSPATPSTPGYGDWKSSQGDESEVDSLTYSIDYQQKSSTRASALGEGETPFFLRSLWSWSLFKGHKATTEATPDIESSLERHNDMDTRPWLMKDPNHAAFLPQLIAQFPDAKLIFAHRAPGDLVASLAKTLVCFACVQHVPGARGTTSKEWGEEALKRTECFCGGLVEFTKQNDGTPLGFVHGGSNQRIDFLFEDLVKDLPTAISKMYSCFFPDRPPPTAEAMKAFRTYLKENERQKRGNQRRSLEDFHLTRDMVAFTEYTEMFLSRSS